ncbi:hypothetical protein LTS18_013789 [Coniosporium uncinatum]|uniref:Uncharacterized protein n=1 Tax=Coniosporium uncinatum TaxID=93489 RepID=A0ACC3DHR2_9PEZI|nr:hypothetical protein LTS18_013789 [Coniosporium uncinatum]
MSTPPTTTTTHTHTHPKTPPFPPHNAPRVWFLTSGAAPLALALARQVLQHGDYVVAGVPTVTAQCEQTRGKDFREFLANVRGRDGISSVAGVGVNGDLGVGGAGGGAGGDVVVGDVEMGGVDLEELRERGTRSEGVGERERKGSSGVAAVAGRGRGKEKAWRERVRVVGLDGR